MLSDYDRLLRTEIAEVSAFRREQSYMTNERAALGGMLEQLADLGVIEFRPEPLDAE